MKIIFLDIDGVIKEDEQGSPFIDESLRLLSGIVRQTGARLVMSSSWKVKYSAFLESGTTEYEDILALHRALTAHSLTVSDFTPLIKAEKQLRRPAEIREYLARCGETESFVILDDRTNFLWDELSPRLVCTVIKTNENKKTAHLTEISAGRAVELLNNN